MHTEERSILISFCQDLQKYSVLAVCFQVNKVIVYDTLLLFFFWSDNTHRKCWLSIAETQLKPDPVNVFYGFHLFSHKRLEKTDLKQGYWSVAFRRCFNTQLNHVSPLTAETLSPRKIKRMIYFNILNSLYIFLF